MVNLRRFGPLIGVFLFSLAVLVARLWEVQIREHDVWAREAATSRSRSFAAWIAVAFALSLLAPGGTYSLPRVLANVYAVGQALCWLVAMVFLASAARRPYHEARAGAGS